MTPKPTGGVCVSLLGALLLSGCGGGSSRVAGGGRVTLGGENVKAASISFRPQQGPGAAALAEVKDGVYVFTRETGPVPGPQRVTVDILGNDKFDTMQGKSGGGGGRWTFEYQVPATGPFAEDFDLDVNARVKGP